MSGDRRFEAMHSAPIFKQSKKDSFKVKVDDRFKSLLTDERFQSVHGKVDKYGRKNKVKDNAKKVVEELKGFYDIDEGDEQSATQSSSAKPKAKQPQGGNMESRLDYLNRLARGEVSEESSSDSDGSDDENGSGSEDSSDESDGSEAEREQAGASSSRKSALAIPDQPEPELSEDISSTRIAIQNCDWENVSAEDIMVVLQSFCPPGSGSSVHKVTVYVSDFGKKRMELESRYGPQGIWKEVQREEEEDENADLYEGIDINDSEEDDEDGSEGEGEEEGESQDDSEGEEDDVSEGSDADAGQHSRKQQTSKKSLKGADFVRRKGAVGLVLQSDIEGRGRNRRRQGGESESDSGSDGSHSGSEDEEDDDASDSEASGGEEDGGRTKTAKSAKKPKDGDGFDEVALRKYELSKLRYYFAVAECDSARTANRLYEELDGVEMEASSMVFDLSLVPEELSFEDREVRDAHSASASGAVNPNYKPPDFVVNALQHTKVQCSWDEGEKLRDRHLSNFSTWRNLNESELQQYVASSVSSDNDDDDEEEEGPSAAARGKGGKKQKAANMRKLLLGGEGESDGSEEDDFFAKDGSDAGDRGGGDDNSMYGSDGEVPEGFSSGGEGEGSDGEDGEGKTLTYIPELGKDILAKKRGAAEETPYEAEMRKMAEKKKARKAAKKEFQEKQEAEKKAAAEAARKGGKSKGAKEPKAAVITDDEARRQAELELLFEGEGDLQAEDDYDMRELVLAEKEKARGGKKNKRKKGNDGKALVGEDFQLDMADPRFSRLFEGDARFGIDKTSTEFRPTPASKEILAEQARRRAQKERHGGASRPAPEAAAPQAGKRDDGEAKTVDVDNLVSKLKRKYAKV